MDPYSSSYHLLETIYYIATAMGVVNVGFGIGTTDYFKQVRDH